MDCLEKLRMDGIGFGLWVVGGVEMLKLGVLRRKLRVQYSDECIDRGIGGNKMSIGRVQEVDSLQKRGQNGKSRLDS